jgi:pyoverdine/dityrosine biosynthesis protein Dit1
VKEVDIMTTQNNTRANGWSSAVTAAGSSIGTNDDIRQAKELLLKGDKLERGPARIATEAQFVAIVSELRGVREQLAEGYIRKARKHESIADAILTILRNSAMSVTRSGFGDEMVEAQMRAKLENMLRRNQPIVLPMLMGGAKAPNPVKVGTNYLPDLSEWTAWSTLEAIGIAIREFYSPGAKILVVPDAGLHTADIGMPIEETIAHALAVKRDRQLFGLEYVNVPDVLQYLTSEWVDGVQALVADARRRAESNPAFADDLRSQIGSLVYSLNTRVLGRSFEDLVPVYAAAAGHIDGLPVDAIQEARELQHRSESIAFHYVAVNWAIRQLGLVERIVQDLFGSEEHLRMSVHAKPGEPRPSLFAPSKHFPGLGGLLPMHSVGVRLQLGEKIRYGAAFELSARLRRWTPLISGDDGRFLWFEAKLSPSEP